MHKFQEVNSEKDGEKGDFSKNMVTKKGGEVTPNSAASNLYEALRNAGIPVPDQDTETFRMVRWGKNKRYWLKKFDGGYVYGDFANGISEHVFDKSYKNTPPAHADKSLQEARKKAEEELHRVNENAAQKASEIWNEAKESSKHKYLEDKQVASHGLKEYEGRLVIPLYDVDGKLHSLQFIDTEGQKRFLSGGKKKACHFIIGDIKDAIQAFICEGYATGATVYECLEIPTVIAFDAGNLKPVAQALKGKHTNLNLIICADNDQYGDVNTGVEKAREAATYANAVVVIPQFEDISTKPTDFNDLMRLEGHESVKQALSQGIKDSAACAGVKIPEGFMLSADGLFCIDKKTKQPIRISNYIKVIAFTKNDDEVSRLVEFIDYDGHLQTFIVKAAMFTRDGDQLSISLMKRGFVFAVTSLFKRKLQEYISISIPTKRIQLASKTGFLDNVYVRSDRVIGQSSEEVILDPSVNDQAIGISGTLTEWNDYMARWCVGNSRLIFAVISGFASVLLRICGIPNFGFHFVGNSSSGKTTCLNVAASVFGSPEYLVSWKTTDNALENTAMKRNDALLILDELSEISPSKAGDVAYMLANGQGKKRLDKNCNERETLAWRLIFLSSGEVDLASHMAEDRKTSKAGQKVRFLNIPAKASKESFGIFEDLRSFQDGAEFSNYLRNTASKYYGTPAVAFIEKVLENRRTIKPRFKEEFRRLKAQYLPEKAAGQDLRAFEKFMFVGFAGELAIEYGVVCWKPGAACSAAIACFNSWLEDKEGVGDDENKQILEHVKAFFELHGHSRFFDLDGLKEQKIMNMAGYKAMYRESVTFFVSPSVFDKEICKGFNRKAVIQLLIDKGFLLKDHNNDYKQQKWTPDGNKRVYVISGNVLL